MLKMSIEAKEAFINRIRMKLSDWCIPVQTDKMLGIVSDCLFGFDINVTENDNVYIGVQVFGRLYFDMRERSNIGGDTAVLQKE